MSTTPYIDPAFDRTSFNCPTCGAFAQQRWGQGGASWIKTAPAPQSAFGGVSKVDELWVARCAHCGSHSFWVNGSMVFPLAAFGPSPSSDLSDEIRADYNEARTIAAQSPRGAAAILRLCVQKLCKQLGEKGKKIDDDIAALVQKGLPVEVQQALDAVRVIGNNAVHPLEMDLKDASATVEKLFGLINFIAYQRITHPKELRALYSGLPEGAKDAINKRDGVS